jgi:hypothetical protein
VVELGARGRGRRARREPVAVHAGRADPLQAGERPQLPGQILDRPARRGVHGRELVRAALAQGGRRDGQHRRVRGPWAAPADPHERLRADVVQPVPGGVDGVARQERGEREVVALGRARVAAARGGHRPARQARGLPGGERRDGRGRGVSGASTAWAREFAALAASPRAAGTRRARGR